MWIIIISNNTGQLLNTSIFIFVEGPSLTEATDFVTNRSPNKETYTENAGNAQPKSKFRHPQQNRGRKNHPNYEVQNPTSQNSPNLPNTHHSTSTPYQKKIDHENDFDRKGTNSNTRNEDVSKEKVNIDPDPSEEVQRGAWTIAWEAHVYFSGTLFVLLAAYCSVNIARLHTFSRLFR